MINTRDLELGNKPTMDNIQAALYTAHLPTLLYAFATIQFEFSSLKANITVEGSVKEENDEV